MIISIVIPVYNMADELRATLESCIAQDLDRHAWEIVVVDGGSTDDTERVVEEFKSSISEYVSEQDHGIYDAMNKGARLAKGKYLQFLNCGDFLADPDTLSQVVKCLDVHTASLWAISAALHLHGGRMQPTEAAYFPHRWWKHLLGRQPHIHQAVFFSREMFLQLGGYDLSTSLVADYDLMLRLGLLEPPTEIPFKTILYAGGGISQRKRAEIPILLHKVRRERLNLTGLPLWLSYIYATQKSAREWLEIRERAKSIIHKQR